MFRVAQNYLKEWYKSSNRKPLVLRGARQVGKSTLIKNFSTSNDIRLIEINLEKIKLHTLNHDEISIEALLQEIETKLKLSLETSSPYILFFDEIQEQPKCLLYLRYFYEEHPHIPVISAGSLLEFAIEDATFSFPVGRIEFLYLGPMTFYEFLLATKNEKLTKFLDSKEVPDYAHKMLVDLLMQYYFVGGMPEAIAVYLKKKNFIEVKKVHESILKTYLADFPKYAKKVLSVQNVYQKVATYVGQKIKFSKIDPEAKANEVRKAFLLLFQARILIPVYHSNASGLPLAALIDDSVFKVYYLDIGLFNHLSGLEWNDLLQNKQTILTKGYLAEQFVAQHLWSMNDFYLQPELHYWLRDGKNKNAEVDFVVSRNSKIIPVEVKSDHISRLYSIAVFAHEKKIDFAIRFNLEAPSYQSRDYKLQIGQELISGKFTLLSLPIYQAGQLGKILDRD